MAMDIEPVLAAFDGTHVAPLRGLARRELDASGLAMLLDAVPGPHEAAATWVVKARAEAGLMAQDHLARVIAALPRLSDPKAILHTLQVVRFHPSAAAKLLPHLVRLAGHPNLLIRVWTFDAYCRATTQEDRVPRILQGLGMREKAMRARARGLAQEFGVPIPPKA